MAQSVTDPRTLFHVTHWKAGSQWLAQILEDVVPDRVVRPALGERQLFVDPIRKGKIYAAAYVTQGQLELVAPGASASSIIVLRDLRDTLVSAYFSVMHSHALMDESIVALRQHLHACSQETGLLTLMEKWLPACAAIQASWLHSRCEVIRYEALLQDDEEILQRALVRSGLLQCSPEVLSRAIASNRFQVTSAGRNAGTEDRGQHNRKGVAGDWKNHFSARVQDRFQTLYGGLIAAYMQGSRPHGQVIVTASDPSTSNDGLASQVCVEQRLQQREIAEAFDVLVALYPYVPSYVMWMAQECAAFRQLSPAGDVLDHGCPDGRLATWVLSGARSIVGLAQDATTGEQAANHGRYERIIGWQDVEQGLVDNRFDVVYSRCTLSQAEDLGQTLRALFRTLRPGGRLLCSVLTDRLKKESGVAQLFRVHGFPAAAEEVHARYTATHNIRHALSIERWLAEFTVAGFVPTFQIPVMSEMSFQAFSLIDSVWHQQAGQDARQGDALSAALAADDSWLVGFRQIVAGLAAIRFGAESSAACVFCLEVPHAPQ